jgi:RNA polymerase sigma-70 factor (ECF subfamily)
MAWRGKRMTPTSIVIGLDLEPVSSSAPRTSQSQAFERSDAELVAAACAGQRAAEAVLYRRHARAVTAVTVRLLGRTADAEDVMQDTFLTAFERLRQLRDPQQFRSWVVRIAVRHVHRRFRRRRLLRVLGLDRGQDDAALAQLAQSPIDTETRAELGRLDRALGALPARQRIAFMLRHVEGYELSEVADACEASVATIKRWLSRADEIVQLHAQGGSDE